MIPLSHFWLFLFQIRSCSLQAAATKEIWTAAKDGKEEVVKTCIAKGADVDGHKDEVREAAHAISYF